MDNLCIIYHIDRQGIITYLSDEWQVFADNNQAGQLSAANVLNRPLFDFITDIKCLYLYELLIDVVRKSYRPVKFSFRCDSPDKRRFMDMEITQTPAGSTQFRSCIVKEESRQPVALLDSCVKRIDESITICSMCKKVRISSHEWLEIEKAIEHLQLFNTQVLPKLAHGLCLHCLEEKLNKVHVSA